MNEPEMLAGTTEHPICGACPHFSTCASSCWNEGRPVPGGDRSIEGIDGRRLSLAVTCRMCHRDVLVLFCPDGPSLSVPEGCPRFALRERSALECGECEKDRLRLLNRAGEDRKLADLFVGYMVNALEQSRNRAAFGPTFVDPESHAARVRMMEEASQIVDPTRQLREDAARGKTSRWLEADELLKSLLGAVWSDEVFAEDRARNATTWSIEQHLFQWLRSARWLLDQPRHDPAELARTWALLFTEQPLASRAWTRWSPDRRRAALTAWEEVLGKLPVEIGSEA